jgi:predicted amino acid dehydrogenase
LLSTIARLTTRSELQKRGGDAVHVRIDDAMEIAQEKGTDVVALSDALSALATFDERMSQVGDPLVSAMMNRMLSADA